MQLTPLKGNGIAARPRDAIPNAQALVHENQASLQSSEDGRLHTALRLQLAAHGVSVASACGGLFADRRWRLPNGRHARSLAPPALPEPREVRGMSRDQSKRYADLQARAALLGIELHSIRDHREEPCYVMTCGAVTWDLGTLDEVEEALEAVERGRRERALIERQGVTLQ